MRSRVSVRYGLSRAAKVAVGGSVVVLRDGEVLAPNDLEMHPRTLRPGVAELDVRLNGATASSTVMVG